MSHTDQQKFMELYAPIHDRFERFCRARVYGDMDYADLMNETLLTVYAKFDQLREEKAFLSYLCSVAIRILANAKRKKRTERMGEGKMEGLSDPYSRTDRSMEVEILHRALAELPTEQRECLILFEISGFSIKEISQIQDIGESAVKQRLRRGRLALKALLMDKVEAENETTGHG